MTGDELVKRSMALAIEASGLISLLNGEHLVAAQSRAKALARLTEEAAASGSTEEWLNLIQGREDENAKLRFLARTLRPLTATE